MVHHKSTRENISKYREGDDIREPRAARGRNNDVRERDDEHEDHIREILVMKVVKVVVAVENSINQCLLQLV